MSNHYHLLVKTPRANLSRCMRHIDGVYTQRYNRLKNKDGSLFRGRYKAILIDNQQYLLQVSRYIHRNPIETKQPIVKKLEDYRWSSYLAYLDAIPHPAWLTKDEILSSLNSSNNVETYKLYVGNPSEKELMDFYSARKSNNILGNELFVEKVKKHRTIHPTETAKYAINSGMNIDNIIAAVAKHFAITTKQLLQTNRGRGNKNIPRQVALYLCQRLSEATLQSLAKKFQIEHYSTVSQTMKRFKQELKTDKLLVENLNVICQDLTP
jgi:putative transposase